MTTKKEERQAVQMSLNRLGFSFAAYALLGMALLILAFAVGVKLAKSNLELLAYNAVIIYAALDLTGWFKE